MGSTRTARREQVSCNQTDRDHYCSSNDNRKRAGSFQVGNQAGGYAFSPERKGCSDSEISADHPEDVVKDFAHNVSPCCTERHANADYVDLDAARLGPEGAQPPCTGRVPHLGET